MIDIDKIERAAKAAIKFDGDDPDDWYRISRHNTINVDRETDAKLVVLCDPQSILKLIAVVRAAKATMTVDQDDTVESLAADLTLYAALEALK